MNRKTNAPILIVGVLNILLSAYLFGIAKSQITLGIASILIVASIILFLIWLDNCIRG